MHRPFALRVPRVLARRFVARSLALAALVGTPASTATPLDAPSEACSAQEHERLHGLMRWLATAQPGAIGSIGNWSAAGPARTYFGRHDPGITLDVAVYATRAPSPGDGLEAHFGVADERLPRLARPSFFDALAVPPGLELHRLDAATLRPPRAGEVSVQVRTRGCYAVLLLRCPDALARPR